MVYTFKKTMLVMALFSICLLAACTSYKHTATSPKAGPNQTLDSLQHDLDDQELKDEQRVFDEPYPSLTV